MDFFEKFKNGECTLLDIFLAIDNEEIEGNPSVIYDAIEEYLQNEPKKLEKLKKILTNKKDLLQYSLKEIVSKLDNKDDKYWISYISKYLGNNIDSEIACVLSNELMKDLDSYYCDPDNYDDSVLYNTGCYS